MTFEAGLSPHVAPFAVASQAGYYVEDATLISSVSSAFDLRPRVLVYSYLKACIGSTFDALSAGTYPAASATRLNAITDAITTTGS